MNIAILAVGLRGDVFFNVTLANGLNAAGHNAFIASTQDFGTLIEEYQVPFRPIMINAKELYAKFGGEVINMSAGSVLKFYRTMREMVRPHTIQLLEECLAHCRGVDLIISNHLALFPAYHIAEYLKIPLIYAFSFPLAATKQFPSTFQPFHRLTLPFLNLLTHRIEDRILASFCRNDANGVRERFGLPKMPRNFSYRNMYGRYIPTIISLSPQVLSPPPDWKDRVWYFGYLLPKQEHTPLPPEIERFLSKDPPIYIGFGSMNNTLKQEHLEMVDRVLKQKNVRAIFMVEGSQFEPGQYSPRLLLAPLCDHVLLFPKVKMIIQHGGASTFAASLTAGKPTIIVPFAYDHFFWGVHAERIGVGPRMIPFTKLNEKRLHQAISAVINNPRFTQRAKEISHKLVQEDGASQAVAFITRYAQNFTINK